MQARTADQGPRYLILLLAAESPAAGKASDGEAGDEADAGAGPQSAGAPDAPPGLSADAALTPAAIDPALIDDLLDWIGEHTDYDVDAARETPPRIVHCDCGDAIAYEGDTVTIPEGTLGVYDRGTGTIHLVRPWSTGDTLNVSTLLHEMIHHVQALDHEWWCWQASEWQAYKLQEAWLAERGIDPDFDWFFIFQQSRCTPRDIHP
ncbi:MAG: hypothetical protein RID91_11140 [Azospirillaceae bacterium]